MKPAKPIAFVLLAFLLGGTASQLPIAFGDSSSTSPLQPLWDAIGALNNRQQDLQAQIDELRNEIQKQGDKNPEASADVQISQSDASVRIEVEGANAANGLEAGSGRMTTLVHLVASNSGPDNAVGVKLTFFYKLGLIEIDSITTTQGEQCQQSSRGIIQCYVGTIIPSTEHIITVTAVPTMPDQDAHVVADISSITVDNDPRNNHADTTFVPSQLIPASDSNSESAANSSSESQAAEENNSSSQSVEQPQESEGATNSTAENDTSQEQSSQSDTPNDQESQSSNSDESTQEAQAQDPGSQSTSEESQSSDTSSESSSDSSSGDGSSSDDGSSQG